MKIDYLDPFRFSGKKDCMANFIASPRDRSDEVSCPGGETLSLSSCSGAIREPERFKMSGDACCRRHGT